MTEVQLYKFINDNNIEWHRHKNEGTEDVIILPTLRESIDFVNMLDYCQLDEDGIECRLKKGYLAIWMLEICEYYGIEIENIFKGENWDSDNE
jgi:hypothetical protein